MQEIVLTSSGRYRPMQKSVREYIKLMKGINGYLGRDDALLMACISDGQRKAQYKGKLVDIGAGKGKTSILFGNLAWASEEVHAVDLFSKRDANHPHFNDPREFQKNVEEAGLRGVIRPLAIDTMAEASTLIDTLGEQSARLVHVSGGTDYANVLNDIELAWRLASPKGVVVCDGYLKESHPAITEAIFDATKQLQGKIVPFLGSQTRLYLCVRQNKTVYQDIILGALGEGAGRARLLGQRIIRFSGWTNGMASAGD